MTVKHFVYICCAVAVMFLPPGWAWSRLSTAEAELDAARVAYDQTARDAGELLELRSAQDQVADRRRPEEHVLAHVNRVLAEAGIPSRSLRSVRPEADTALAESRASSGTQYRRQSVRLALDGLTLPELGAFLARWRADTHIWIPRRIELTKHRSRSEEDDRYDATIVISAIYVAEPSP